ncbi:MAG: c-type cytochrome biogenesis protein CcmI [Roseiarcus sp.]
MLWVAFALMTGAALLCALWPLSRQRSGPRGQERAIAFHKAQLAEIERDVERGQLPASEAAGARAEAARRLIAASEAAEAAAPAAQGRPSVGARAAAALTIAVAVPVVALGLYARLGSPNLPDQPILARTADPARSNDFEAAIAKVEAHLIANPDDGLGFKVIAPVYMHLGRFDEAVKAYGEALRLLGEDGKLRADYGEALAAAAGGIVTAQARAAFEQALAERGDALKARYYLGLAAEQDGDKAKAAALYEKLAQDAPPDAPWLGPLRERLASLKGAAASAPASDEAAAVAALDPEAQQAAIRGMVEGLAARLAQHGDDAQGWLRLIRAYCVLHETDKARQAMADARKAMAGDAAAGRDLDALAREFGLGS